MKQFMNRILHPFDPKETNGEGWLEIARTGVHIEMSQIHNGTTWHHAITWIAFEPERKRKYRRKYVRNTELETCEVDLREFYRSSTEWKSRKV